MKKPQHINDGNRYRIIVNEKEFEDVKCTVILNDYIEDETHYPPSEEIVDVLPLHERVSGRKIGLRVYYRSMDEK